MNWNVAIESPGSGTQVQVEAATEPEALQKGLDWINDNRHPKDKAVYKATKATLITETK